MKPFRLPLLGAALSLVALALALPGPRAQSRAAALLDRSDDLLPPPATPLVASAGPTGLLQDRITVLFTPEDTSGTGTVVTLYNTTDESQRVTLDGRIPGGSPLHFDLIVPARDRVHLISDDLVASAPPAWSNSVLTNWTASTTYVEMRVPDGIEFDGHVVSNAGADIDPDADQGARPLRFVIRQP